MYFGKKNITAFATFKNETKAEEELRVEVVENGEYSIDAPEGTVYNKVSASVNVPVKEEQELSVDIAENGEFVNTAPDGKAYNKVTVNVNVPSKEEQEKSVTISKNGTIEVVPDAGKVLSSVKVTADVKSDITILDNIPIVLDFSSGGNQVVEAAEGYAVKAATIQKPATLIPENIAEGVEIAGVVGTHVGGGADVRYVTFMNGNEVLYVKPVAVGDDCADIIARGLIGTPTKASTAQYNYGFLGWGATDNGAYDANILKNITEDKTVYAIYTAIVRLYTITWLDSDGATVLKTEQVAYGAVPSYMPEKEGCSFDSWTPAPVAVTGDATYTAIWIEKITFARGSWADIARISEAGEARQYFAVGDTRVETMGGWGEQTLVILDFDHDDLADGSGKAGISIGMMGQVKSDLSYVTKTAAVVPTALRDVIKKINLSRNKEGSVVVAATDSIEPFSWGDAGFPPYNGLDDGRTKYAYVPPFPSDLIISCRGRYLAGSSYQGYYFYNGEVGRKDNALLGKYYFKGHFCV